MVDSKRKYYEKNKEAVKLRSKKWLEDKFAEGMSWDNYGIINSKIKVWNVDHIKPCASFDMSDPEQQKECFSYKNLQPMWAIDNIRKGKKLEVA